MKTDSVLLITFGEKVYEYFKTNDYDAIISQIGTKEEFQELLTNSDLSESEKEYELRIVENVIPEIKESVQQTYNTTRQKAAEKGVVFEETELLRVEFSDESRDNVTLANIGLIIDDRGTSYCITIERCIKTSNGWRIGAKIGFGKEFYSYKENMEELMKELENAFEEMEDEKTED